MTVSAQVHVVSIVVDGDRIVLSDGARIRLLGVDAPEKHPSEKLTREAALTGRSEEAVVRQGEIASAYLTALAAGRRVIVEYDRPSPEKSQPGGPYAPAMVYVMDDRGKVSYCLNERMLEEGYAFFDREAVFARRPLYEQLSNAARAARRGLWAEMPALGSAGPSKPRSSDGMDPLNHCRTEPACIWVSQNGLPDGPGMWRSKPGMTCPCADVP